MFESNQDGIRTLSLLRNLGHKSIAVQEAAQAKPPDSQLMENALKLAASIDLSELSKLKQAINTVQT